MIDLKSYIREIPDFPKSGIGFKDITPLLKDKKAFSYAIEILEEEFRNKKIDSIVAIESRGFIIGGALAIKMGCGFIPVRKKGKLPFKKISYTYKLEYGEDTLEIHEDALKKGENVLVLDDLLATGGTARAVVELVKKLEANIVGIAFLVELTFLNGREKLKDFPVFTIIKF
jgi:adenine phosphoribosyltransferase